MVSGNELLILILLVGAIAVPALIIGAIVVAVVRRGPSRPQPQSWPGGTPSPLQPSPSAGWYSDPTGRNEQRFWNGTAWTESVASNGQPGADPL